MRVLCSFMIALMLAACGSDQATAPEAGQAWLADAPPGAPVRAAFLQIDNPTSRALTLTKVSSRDFSIIELHVVSMQDGMMRMRQVDALPIKAGERLELAPGGAHLMLKQARRDLRPGDSTSLELTLVDDQGQTITLEVNAKVQNPHKDAAQHEH